MVGTRQQGVQQQVSPPKLSARAFAPPFYKLTPRWRRTGLTLERPPHKHNNRRCHRSSWTSRCTPERRRGEVDKVRRAATLMQQQPNKYTALKVETHRNVICTRNPCTWISRALSSYASAPWAYMDTADVHDENKPCKKTHATTCLPSPAPAKLTHLVLRASYPASTEGIKQL